MKKEILDYLKHDRSFEGAVILYNKYGKSLSIRKQFNLKSGDATFLGLIQDELRKLADISLSEFTAIMKLKPTPMPLQKIVEPVKEITLLEIPENVKKTIKLREHFPFLKERDCPKEAKILVADMISAHEKFRENHARLFDVHSEEEIIAACEDIIEPYLENRQIWDELEAYKEKGEFLGEHPIFAVNEKLEDLRKMTAKQLTKRYKSLESDIRRSKAEIAKNDRPDLLENRKNALAVKELEMAEINLLLENK